MSTSGEIENALGIILPDAYKKLLDSPPYLKNKEYFNFYFLTDVEQLIHDNRAYKMIPDDLSEIDDGSLLGGLKRVMLYGSKRKIIEHRLNYIKEWADQKKFVIGNDGGEEIYFIYLDKPECPVLVYEIETKKSYQKCMSITEYIVYLNSTDEKVTQQRA